MSKWKKKQNMSPWQDSGPWPLRYQSGPLTSEHLSSYVTCALHTARNSSNAVVSASFLWLPEVILTRCVVKGSVREYMYSRLCLGLVKILASWRKFDQKFLHHPGAMFQFCHLWVRKKVTSNEYMLAEKGKHWLGHEAGVKNSTPTMNAKPYLIYVFV